MSNRSPSMDLQAQIKLNLEAVVDDKQQTTSGIAYWNKRSSYRWSYMWPWLNFQDLLKYTGIINVAEKNTKLCLIFLSIKLKMVFFHLSSQLIDQCKMCQYIGKCWWTISILTIVDL